jgi:hypothetical protein
MSVTTTANPLEVVRRFTEACAAGRPEDGAHLVHPDIRFRALIANGAEQTVEGRDAIIAEYRAFIDHYGWPEPLHQNVEQVGSLYRWSTRWRMTKDGEASLFEWHGYMAVEDGLITRFDEVCTGRQLEA